MSNEINVIVVKFTGRKNLMLRYTDPVTGKRHHKSSGTRLKKQAQKAAGEWQAELRAGVASTNRVTQWPAFRQAYEAHVEENQKDKSIEKIWSMFNVIEDLMRPDKLQRISRDWIDRFRTVLLSNGREPSTVESHCRHLKAALNWAKDKGMIKNVPTFPKPSKKARSRKKMKGRPITGEEFDRLSLIHI